MPDVSRLRELLAEGTPRPWRIGLEGDNTGWPESSVWSTEDNCVGECYRNASEQDAALIIAAVNALPKLLDVVEAARAVPRPCGCDDFRNESCPDCELVAALASLETET